MSFYNPLAEGPARVLYDRNQILRRRERAVVLRKLERSWLVFFLCAGAAAWAQTPQSAVSALPRVLMRSMADPEGPVIARLRQGESLNVLRRSTFTFSLREETDYWYQVENPDGLRGWVFGSDIRLKSRREIQVVPSDWLSYEDKIYGFRFRYPPQVEPRFPIPGNVFVGRKNGRDLANIFVEDLGNPADGPGISFKERAARRIQATRNINGPGCVAACSLDGLVPFNNKHGLVGFEAYFTCLGACPDLLTDKEGRFGPHFVFQAPRGGKTLALFVIGEIRSLEDEGVFRKIVDSLELTE